MKRLKLFSGAAAAALATAGLFVAGPIGNSGALAPNTGCKMGMFPVSEASSSNYRSGCVLGGADGGGASVVIHDFNNSTWHDGASRLVKVTATAGSTVLGVTSGVSNLAGTFGVTGTNLGTTPTGDQNRSVEAGFSNGIAKLGTAAFKAGSFIVAETATTITLNQAPVKGGNLSLKIENGPGRTLSDLSTTSGGSTITSAMAHFVGGTSGISSDVGKSIVGTGIPVGATITGVSSPTTASIAPATATATGTLQTATIAADVRNSTQRMVTDMTVNVGTAITSASANFAATDIGLLVKGKGIPANAYITAVGGPTSATISAAATKAAAGIVAVIGLSSATAPVKDGTDLVAALQTEIVLNPSLVAGAPSCTANFLTGTDINGVWQSPSKFILKGNGFFFNDSNIGLGNFTQRPQTPLSSSPIIGQIFFKTPTVNFAAYVQESGPGTGVDITFPFVPTSLGQCAGTDIVSSFNFFADEQSQFSAPSGYGKPGSAGFRRTVALNSAGTPVGATSSFSTYTSSPAVALTGLTFNKVAKTIAATGISSGLVEGQVVTCPGLCTDVGLKNATAYYVHIVDANTIQLSATPIGGPVIFVPLTIKIDQAPGGNTLQYIKFTPVISPLTSATCTIARPAPTASVAAAFPCSAG